MNHDPGPDGTPRRNLVPFPIAIVGAGSAGRSYADSLVGDHRFELVAVIDPRLDRARSMLPGESHTSTSVHDLVDAAPALGLRAAIVCAPTNAHVPLITALLDAGVGVLCHPPLAPSRPSARMIFDTAQASKAPLLIALDHRRSDEVAAASDLIATGQLGELRMMRVHLRSDRPADSGILRELGTVAIDLVRTLVGQVLHVTADAADVSDARTTTAQLLVRTADDLSASVVLSADSALDSGWDVLVEGTEGALRLDADGLSRHCGLGWEPVCARTTPSELRSRHLGELANALRANLATSPFDEANTLAAGAVLEAARRSVEIGGWARVVTDQLARRR
jgi:predicted dehydrogenase